MLINLKKTILTFFSIIISLSFIAQNDVWIKTSSASIISENKVRRNSEPLKAEFYNLNLNLLKSKLIGAPVRGMFLGQSHLILSFPTAEGKLENFRVMESPIMAKALEDKFPMIKTYAAQGIDDPTATMRFSITQFGFHSIVLSGKHSTNYIDTYTNDLNTYIVYDKSSLGANTQLFECLTNDNLNHTSFTNKTTSTTNNTNDQKLRTYRLALSCTAEYGNIFAGTATPTLQIANIQAQMAITMNRVNGVFERDLAITMQFVPNNDLLIYFGSTTTDPWNGEYNTATAQTIDAAIGITNYDIGHNFNTTGGGNAGCLSCVCLGSAGSQSGTHKGRGMTGRSNPTGDAFDIDYVAHEMGHQYGGYHVMNTCSRSGNGFTEVEPASGSSVMGYAGICTTDIQPNSNDDFNYVNVRDISLNVQTGNSTCAQITNLVNNPPTASAGNDYIIPKSTAYILEGTGNDIDGSASLTYNWSQNDPTQSPGNAEPQSTYAVGPLYRSLPPGLSPNRWMPNITTVLSNTLASAWEVTPSVARSMNFSFIVRDNDVNGGQTASDLMIVTVSGNAGPFIVTSQNSSTTWNVGATETITWDVANTNVAPVNATNVTIYLSTDGGYTYPTILASNVPNNGSATISVPTLTTTQGRIMVRGANSIFYDINNTNVTIQQVEFVLSTQNASSAICAPNNSVYTFTYNTFLGFTETTVFSATDLPAGTTAVFNPTSTSVNGTVVTMTLSGITTAITGTHNFSVTGTATSVTQTKNFVLNVLANSLIATALSTPANTATGVFATTNLTWVANSGSGITYQIEIATDANFTNTIINTSGLTATSYSTSLLLPSTTYYWRVKASNACTSANYSNTFSFTTGSCNSLASVNIPILISASNANTINSTLNVTASGIITDVNVIGLIGTHTYVSDLNMKLKSPTGTSISLFANICANNNDFNLNFDDAAPVGPIQCPATGGGFYKPVNPLSVFNGQLATGIWTLTVSDIYGNDGGSLNGWGLAICTTSNSAGILNHTLTNLVSIYPNPTNGLFNLVVSSDNNYEMFNYKITNNLGQIIDSNVIDGNKKQVIDLTKNSSGVYFITIQSNADTKTEKIILQH